MTERQVGSSRRLRWFLLALAVALVALVVTSVDLTPRVESDFFFATDDPQLATANRIDELFPSAEQLFLRAAPGGTVSGGDEASEAAGSQSGAASPDGGVAGDVSGVRSEAYLAEIRGLSDRLAELSGVSAVQSLTRGPSTPAAAFDSPFWSRLLIPEGEAATNLVLQLSDDADRGVVVSGVEGAVVTTPLVVDISGVPYVVELVKRYLLRDLRLFSAAALVVFGLLVGLLFQSRWVVAGTLATCLAACAVTLGLLGVAGVPIGVLTANLVTIVFVLTLSHTVFLTANARRAAATGVVAGQLPIAAVRRTFSASFWCMVTTLLGFLSLHLAFARPLQELGTAGAVGTLTALVLSYLLYPPFLAALGLSSEQHREAQTEEGRSLTDSSETGNAETDGGEEPELEGAGVKDGRLSAALVAGLCLVAVPGLFLLSTDPNLLSFFKPGSELRQGLERIDEDGGSSPLSLVVEMPAPAASADGPEALRLDTQQAVDKLAQLQADLDADPETGVVLGLPALLDEARRASMMTRFLPSEALVAALASEQFDQVALSFITPQRDRARFFLRMREGERREPRQAVVARLEEAARLHGFRVPLAGGLYELQGQLSSLVGRSLVTGLAGLLALFTLIAALVSRNLRSSVAMVGCLILVPLFLLGMMGYLQLPLDIISSPAANVAIALGVDSMIHMATAARRARRRGASGQQAWALARIQLTRPVAGAALIIATGFGLFALSSFPPTQRFGIAVLLGTAMAAAVALLVLPKLAAGSPPRNLPERHPSS